MPGNFQSTIINLINSRREGEYWDFKEEPYHNNASLLHDILSLANCPYLGDRYLIIGVSDPATNCIVKGLAKGQINRKTQADYIDFLRSQKFAGDNRPVIELRSIEVDSLEVDVVVVFDRPLKPYYLTSSYRDREKEVRANYIYTRTIDSNTPIDKSADIFLIEKMWWQRFKLDLAPMDRMKYLLQEPEKWVKDIGNKKYMSHRQFPEYTVELSEVERFDEPYSFFFTNEKSFLGNAVFKYHTTILFEHEYMYCDEMRIILPVPETAYIKLGEEEQWYYYYNLSELNGVFLAFLTEKKYDFRSRGSGAPFLIFKTTDSQEAFEQYVKANVSELKQLESRFWAEQAIKRIKQAGMDYMTDPLFLDKIQQLYDKWSIRSI